MISELRLEKFQGFGLEADASLKPLTLIYGANASGKSSIIRALLFAKQSLPKETHSLLKYSGFDGFVFEGEFVSLASFANAVYKHNENESISLGLSLRENQISRPIRNSLINLIERVDLDWCIDSTAQFRDLRISFKFKSFEAPLSIDFNRRDGRLLVKEIKGSAEKLPDLNKLLSNGVRRRNSNSKAPENQSSTEFPYIQTFEARQFSKTRFLILGNLPRIELVSDSGGPSIDFNSQPEHELLNELVQAARWLLNENLSEVLHIKPLRDIDHRFTYEGEGQHNDFDVLNYPSDESIDLISQWIAELTQGRYRFKAITYVAEEVKYIGKLRSLILLDTVTETQVSFRDVGVGLSQIKPILEGLVLAQNSKKSMMLIEQPELHLHPKMQGDLAELLARFVTNNSSVQIIAETHSEAMLLRLQKLMRDGLLDPKNVQILFTSSQHEVEQPGNCVSEIGLNPENDFDFDLPISFTELRYKDLI